MRTPTIDLRKRLPRLLKLVAINVTLAFVLLELTSVGVYFFRTGEFFYGRRNRDRLDVTKYQLESSVSQLSNTNTKYQLHPYFGFVSSRGYVEPAAPKNSSNNFGFLSPHDFPFQKTHKDQFIIGVFGGSVAAIFNFFERKEGWLDKALKRHPGFQNKEIVVLNFAAGNYKQPQQLLVLNYFLSIGQEFDMVINIDGFNDIVFSYSNYRFGIQPSMPNAFITLPLVDMANKGMSVEEMELSLDIIRLKAQLKTALSGLENCRFATCYTLRWIQLKYLFNRYQKEQATFIALPRNAQEKSPVVFVNLINKPFDDAKEYEQAVELWANSSLMMNDLLTARKIPYFHFIQPNQYYPTKRLFSEEEKAIAFSKDSTYREPVTHGYPKLLLKAGHLQESKLNLINAVNLFDDVPGAVYSDDCCHYTPEGYEILANYMAQNIINVLIRSDSAPKPVLKEGH